MQDIYDVIENVNNIYDSNSAFEVLKDFERVIDELDIYVYDNWKDGELVSGPKITRHWVSCSFMWPLKNMPDPMGGKRLLDYDCKVRMGKDFIIKPRKIRKPDDIRPGTKKGNCTYLSTTHLDLVSSLAASSISTGTMDNPANKTKATNGVHCHTSQKIIITKALVGSPIQLIEVFPSN